MNHTICIEIKKGPSRGKTFNFHQHDIFLFGRDAEQCHAHIDEDPFVSRYHFLLEVHPPFARLRDLGSRNGTFVNGVKHGGRSDALNLTLAKRCTGPTVDLVNGDIIKAGKTEFRVIVETPNSETTQSYVKQSPQAIAAHSNSDHNDVERNTSIESESLFRPAHKSPAAKDSSRQKTTGKRKKSKRALSRQDNKEVHKTHLDHANALAQSQELPTIDGYETLKVIGSGAMGIVYQARSLADDQIVAIKLLRSQVRVSPKARAAFLREMEIVSRLRHRNIIQSIDAGGIGDEFYFVMEYCEGGPIGRVFRQRKPLTEKRIARLLNQLLDGLSEAHEKGLIHRDLKPANILLKSHRGRWLPKLADFGLAKDFEKAGFSGMTVTGVYGGSFPYMPREQLTNYKYVNPGSDVFSLAASMFRLITGQYPRAEVSQQDPLTLILNGTSTPIRQLLPDFHPGLAELIDIALLEDCNERFGSAREMQKALIHVMRKEGWS